jgi:hypothetical protein
MGERVADKHAPQTQREQRPDVDATVAHMRDLADQIHQAVQELYAEIARLQDEDHHQDHHEAKDQDKDQDGAGDAPARARGWPPVDEGGGGR